MDDIERRAIWRRRLLRLYWVMLVVWVVALVLTLTVFGGFGSPLSAVSVAITFLVIVFGIVSFWMSGREDRSSR